MAGTPGSARQAHSLRAYYALAALVVGLVAGMLANDIGAAPRDAALGVTSFIGTLWLNALKMTVIPLVVARTAPPSPARMATRGTK